MAYRCDNCNVFCSIELGDPEDEGIDISSGELTGSVRLVLTSQCCSEEKAESTVDASINVDHECEKSEDPEFDLEGLNLEPADWSTKKKPNTPLRYQKRFYGVDISATARCQECGETTELSDRVGEQASYFEQI